MGVSGMILFIPFVGILKIVSENLPEWEDLNILLGRGNHARPANNKTPQKIDQVLITWGSHQIINGEK